MPYILVVEDNDDAREALCAFLRKSGYEAEGVNSGREAIGSVIEHPPDLMVLDLFMPQMDGGGFLEVIRSYLRLQSLPVIIWTAFPDSPLVARVRDLKVNTILTKGKASFGDMIANIQRELSLLPN